MTKHVYAGDWQENRVADTTIWLFQGNQGVYRITERSSAPNHFVADELLHGDDKFMEFMSANTLRAAQLACKTMDKTFNKRPEPE